jgi:hypothetical protein
LYHYLLYLNPYPSAAVAASSYPIAPPLLTAALAISLATLLFLEVIAARGLDLLRR